AMRAGRDLDRARPDPGVADPLADLLYIDGGNVLDRELAKRVRDPFRLEVSPRRTDDSEPAPLRQLGQELDVATEIHRARVDERSDPEIAELLQLVDAARHGLGAVEPRGERVHLPAGKADQHVLVDQGASELADRHAA